MSVYGAPGLGLAQLNQRNAALAAQQQAFLAAHNQMAATAPTLQNHIWLNSTTNVTTNGTVGGWVTVSSGTTVTPSTFTNCYFHDDGDIGLITQSGRIKLTDGQARTIELPDGTIIDVKADGSFTINDKDAKVIYRASRMRDFNPFINVSDRLEEFIDFCGKQGVRQGEMLELPLSLFIGWLVIQAAKADKEPEPPVALLPDLRRRIVPRCPGCGRFTLSNLRAKRIEFCAPACFDHHYQRHVKTLPPPIADQRSLQRRP